MSSQHFNSMKKWPEYMVTTDQCDIAYAFLDAIASPLSVGG